MAARRCPRTAPGTLAFEFLHSASEKGRGDLRSTDGPDSVRVADDTPGTAGASFAVDLFIGIVDCLAPGCNGFRAAFQWEMKCTADEAQPGKVRRGLWAPRACLEQSEVVRPREAQSDKVRRRIRAPKGRNNEAQANGLGQRNPHQPRALKGRSTQSLRAAFTVLSRSSHVTCHWSLPLKPADAPRHRLPGRTDGLPS